MTDVSSFSVFNGALILAPSVFVCNKEQHERSTKLHSRLKKQKMRGQPERKEKGGWPLVSVKHLCISQSVVWRLSIGAFAHFFVSYRFLSFVPFLSGAHVEVTFSEPFLRCLRSAKRRRSTMMKPSINLKICSQHHKSMPLSTSNQRCIVHTLYNRKKQSCRTIWLLLPPF